MRATRKPTRASCKIDRDRGGLAFVAARAVGARGLGVGLLRVLEGADRGDDLLGGEVDAARVRRRTVLAEVLGDLRVAQHHWFTQVLQET